MENKKNDLGFIFVESPKNNTNEKISITRKKSSRQNKSTWSQIEYEEKRMVWVLGKNVYEVLHEGMDFFPVCFDKKLENRFTAETICIKLNQENLFEFEYFPQENDCLIIKYEYLIADVKHRIRPNLSIGISFVYSDNSWTVNEEFYDQNHHFVEFKRGRVQFIS